MAAVIDTGVVKKKKERTHLMSIHTLDQETDYLHHCEGVGDHGHVVITDSC